jgi:hypothetical protein
LLRLAAGRRSIGKSLADANQRGEADSLIAVSLGDCVDDPFSVGGYLRVTDGGDPENILGGHGAARLGED